MKKIKLLLAVFALSLVTITATATTNESEPKKSSKQLRSKIVKLLGDQVPAYLTNGKDVKAELSLMLNNENQIIIISVDSKSTTVDGYVKGKLNYQTVNVKGLKKGEIYRVPLTIKQS